MTQTYRVLGQLAPAANTQTVLYTVGVTSTIVSSIIICNTNSATATFSISIGVNGASITQKSYLYSGVSINGNSTIAEVLGLTLASGDVVWVTSSNANLSFNLFGQENS